ncbi:Cro/CI family transcriptional regulator [Aeromonas caviae]|uniref:Cro/CI family transcriptional regulator n=1 Tax=Aeromonas caviae TaxID=648 RepID=UPI0009BAFD27|nr:Cro/CI family transcriptional regulator [Aeromonas caviae]
MKTDDVIAHFGGITPLAKALEVKTQAISQWGENIPKLRAYQIEVLTGGELKADPATPSGQQRPYQRVAPGTPLADTPSVQRATDTAKDTPTKAQPGKA